MPNIFTLKHFSFPYKERFPGQATEEKILYVTREHRLFLIIRLLFVLGIALAIVLATSLLTNALGNIFGRNFMGVVLPVVFLLMGAFALIGSYWVFAQWQKSVAILTDQRLTKFIYTTPFNRYTMSLPLEMIVDTSCNNKGLLSSWLKIGTLTARSSASSSGVATDDTNRINKKYFYLENVKYFEDLQQYLSKILSLLHKEPAKLAKMRPFIPHLKGEKRQRFLEENFPEYL